MSHIHIPDGVLPFWLWASGWLLALVLVGLAGKLAERADARRKVPLLGVVSALMLVAMSSEIVPLAYHINLTVVGGVLLGPVLAPIAAFIVEIVLAMLGHGGVTVLGLNTLVMSFEMLAGWALFRLFVRALGRPRIRAAAVVTTVLTLAMSTTLMVGVVWLGGANATVRETGALDPSTLKFENPFSHGVLNVGLFSGGEHPAASAGGAAGLSLGRFAAVVYTLGPIGWVIEALVTAWVLGYVARVRPSLVFGSTLGAQERRPPGDEARGA